MGYNQATSLPHAQWPRRPPYPVSFPLPLHPSGSCLILPFCLSPDGEGGGAEMPLSRLHLPGRGRQLLPPGCREPVLPPRALHLGAFGSCLWVKARSSAHWQPVQGRCSCRQSWKIPAVLWPQKLAVQRPPPPCSPHLACSPALSPARPLGTPAALEEGSLAYAEAEGSRTR